MDTNKPPNPEKPQPKYYGCPVEATLEVIGGKWKCVILWWLCQGTKRFGELMLLIPEISQKVLTDQLRKLEADDLVQRMTYRESPPRVEYSVTDRGQSLQPLVELMCDWGKGQIPRFDGSVLKLTGLKFGILTEDFALRQSLTEVLGDACGAECLDLMLEKTGNRRLL